MRDKPAGLTAGIIAILGRVAAAFCLSFLFNVICFGLLWWSESFLPQNAVRILTRIIWWPVVITCGVDPRDLICALPGIIFGFLFHWLVAFVLLWWLKKTRTRDALATPLLK
jgi:hypothetical protein